MPVARPSQAQESADTQAAIARAAAASLVPGDRVIMTVWHNEKLIADTVDLDHSGEVVLAVIGRFRVAGVPIERLHDSVQTRVAERLRNADVRVKAQRRLTVEGEVRSPGVSFADVTMTLREVIGFSGGLTESAHRDRITIVRNGQRIRVPRWSTAESNRVEVQSGDQVIVGRRSWLALNVLPVVNAIGIVAGIVVTAIAASGGGGGGGGGG